MSKFSFVFDWRGKKVEPTGTTQEAEAGIKDVTHIDLQISRVITELTHVAKGENQYLDRLRAQLTRPELLIQGLEDEVKAIY